MNIIKRCFIRKLTDIKVLSASYRAYHEQDIMQDQQIMQDIETLFEPVTVENQYFRLEDTVIPLYRTPYIRQLSSKYKQCRNVVYEICRRSGTRMHRVQIFPTAPSPVTEEYRNKDEFSFNVGADGDPKTLGLFIGRTSERKTVCVRPHKLPHVKLKHRKIAEVFEDFVRQSSLPVSHAFNDDGYWRTLLIKSNRNDEIMVCVIVTPKQLSQEEEEEKYKIIKHFQNAGCDITSLYFQQCPNSRCSREQAPYQLLHGNEFIFETLHDFKFRISPDSFFQVNTKAAEVLYKEVFNLSDLEKSSTLLDLYCGVGAMSILYSPYVRGSIGVELLPSAIEDAYANANLNQSNNCEFVPGKVELILRQLLEDLDRTTNLTIIMNPGRGGVHKRVIKLIRKSPQIRKLIYISCKPDNPASLDNFVKLLVEDEEFTEPFELSKVKPVDMFPHTDHCEVILKFARRNRNYRE